MSYKVAPLTVNPKQKSTLSSKVFVSQPSAEEEQLVGRLFVLMEIDHSRADEFSVADFIVKEIYRHYYENEQFFLREKIANLKIDYIFEAALTKLNKGIAEFLETEKIHLNPENLNIVIGVLHKNRLLFAHIGPNKAMLLYRPKSKTGEALLNYNLLDVSEKTEDPTSELVNTNKLFANVVNGLIPPRGYFLFANEAVMEYLSKKQLTDIVTTLPPAGAAEQLRTLLEQTDAYVPFFALIVKNTSGEEYALPTSEVAALPETALSPAGGGRVSVDQLNLTQQKTEQLLTPSGMLTVKKWLNRLRPASTDIKSFAQDKARQLNISAGRLNIKRQKLQLGKKTADVLKILASLLMDAGRFIFSLFTDPTVYKNILENSNKAARRLVFSLRNIIDTFRSLQPKHKILLSVIGCCLLLFIGNRVYSSIVSSREAAAARVAETQTAFEQKEHQLEASLLYNNTEGARTLLTEMNDLINSLPQKTEKEKAVAAELTTRYHQRLDALYNITRLNNPSPFVELPADGDSLVLANGRLYSANGQNKTVYQIALDKSITNLVGDFSGKTINVLNDEGDVYVWDADSLYSLQGSSFKKATIENKPASIEAAAVYNTRLYALSSADKTIYRFNQDKKSFSFSNRQNWLKEDVAPGAISSLTVNGRIYVVAGNAIKEYAGGNSEDLRLDDTSPALQNPTMALSSPDQKSLYILEPANKRVLVYSNAGKYIAQYVSESFGSLKGLAIDESAKKLYVLNGKAIYELEIPLQK